MFIGAVNSESHRISCTLLFHRKPIGESVYVNETAFDGLGESQVNHRFFRLLVSTFVTCIFSLFAGETPGVYGNVFPSIELYNGTSRHLFSGSL